MPVGPTMFRGKALKHISSPEQLDRLVRITTPRRWIGLAGLLVVVAGAVIWSTVSTVPTTLTGAGFLLPQGGLRSMQAPATGVVDKLSFAIGDHVIAGDSIGSISPAGGGGPIPITVPETGTLHEVDTAKNNYVTAGSQLGVIEPAGWPLVVYAFLPTSIAAGIPSGLKVQIVFGGGVGAQYGFVLGHVQSVSKFPVTQSFLQFELPTAQVGQLASGGPQNQIVIGLDQSPTTPNGLVWGSGSGPPSQIPAGLPANVTYLLGSHHPIDNIL